MIETKFYIELSEEIEEFLSDNQITIEDILQNGNINADITYGELPYQLEEGAREKKIIPIIIASSISAIPISFAITNILNTTYNKPYLIEINGIEELRDENEKIILDKENKPIYKPIKKYELLQPRPENNFSGIEIDIKGKEDFLIKFGTTEKQK